LFHACLFTSGDGIDELGAPHPMRQARRSDQANASLVETPNTPQTQAGSSNACQQPDIGPAWP